MLRVACNRSQIPGFLVQHLHEHPVTTILKLICRSKYTLCYEVESRASAVFRSGNDTAHILTLISSSSARISATHGDPRLPNLKRRLPEEKKKQLRRQGPRENNKLISKAQNGWARVAKMFRT